mgnify:CR=1 FL=1
MKIYDDLFLSQTCLKKKYTSDRGMAVLSIWEDGVCDAHINNNTMNNRGLQLYSYSYITATLYFRLIFYVYF